MPEIIKPATVVNPFELTVTMKMNTKTGATTVAGLPTNPIVALQLVNVICQALFNQLNQAQNDSINAKMAEQVKKGGN